MISTTSPATTLRSENTIWPPSTRVLLIALGGVLAIASFSIVMLMPTLPWPPTQAGELRASYDGYLQTGHLLVAHAESAGALSAAAWNEPPGPYIAASLMSHVTGSESPYPGLTLLQAILVALPLLWLPVAVARLFRRARAGYALVLMPALTWLMNGGTVLLGTELGLVDPLTGDRVSTMTGITGSIVFVSLSIVLLCTSFRLTRARLIALLALVAVLSAVGNLFGTLAGVGIAITAAALWWKSSPGRLRLVSALAAAAVTVALALAIQWCTLAAIDTQRATAIGVSTAELPVPVHPWDVLLEELTFPATTQVGPDDGQGDEGLTVGDASAAVGTVAYRDEVRAAYFAKLGTDPAVAFDVYLANAIDTVKGFGAMIVFSIVGFAVALTRRAPQRRPLAGALLVALPTLMLGALPPTLAGPTLENMAQLSAALGLLCAVALGALTWSITSMPSHVRSLERSRVSSRTETAVASTARAPLRAEKRYSVVVPTRNGSEVIARTLAALADRLGPQDEIIVVENGSTDGTPQLLDRIHSDWDAAVQLILVTSSPGLGEALRTGSLHSRGRRLLLTADDLPFGFTDLDEFEQLPSHVIVGIGSKAHPQSTVVRGRVRMVQSRAFRFLRGSLLQSAVGDSQGTLWVDGAWGRSFARLSRETGLMWTTELVLAAEQQQLEVREVPVALSVTHESGASRFKLGDAWQSFVGFARLAIYKDDYCNEEWERFTHPSIDGPDSALAR